MINFSKYKYIAITASILLILAGFISTFFYHKGFAHSLDFNGGFRAVIDRAGENTKEEIENFFTNQGISAIVILIDKSKNHYQIDVGLEAVEKIKAFNQSKNLSPETVSKAEKSDIEQFIFMLQSGLNVQRKAILSADQVGAIVGEELTSAGTSLLLTSLALMAIYLSFRFQFKFALGASLALLHDLLFTLAFIGAFQIKPSVPIIAALLTLFGYSINDTIVIFDRIRENLSDTKVQHDLANTINDSINQTLGRTINTSFSTLISVVAIIIGGATELYDFAIVLIFGIVVGTYSSIFIASPIVEVYEKLFPKKS